MAKAADRLKEIEAHFNNIPVMDALNPEYVEWLIKRVKMLEEFLHGTECDCRWERGIMTNERKYHCPRCKVLDDET